MIKYFLFFVYGEFLSLSNSKKHVEPIEMKLKKVFKSKIVTQFVESQDNNSNQTFRFAQDQPLKKQEFDYYE